MRGERKTERRRKGEEIGGSGVGGLAGWRASGGDERDGKDERYPRDERVIGIVGIHPC